MSMLEVLQKEYNSIDKNTLFKTKKKKEAPGDTTKNVEGNEASIERRLEISDKILNELIQLGAELVTNVKVANEKREVARRNDEAVKREDVLQDLRNESVTAIKKFEAITVKWSKLREIKEPVALFEEFQIQKQYITKLMKQKDDIIAECQAEIIRADKTYFGNLQKQTTDIYSLVERIDNQIEFVKKLCNEHIELLLSTIEAERKNASRKASENWEELHKRWTYNEEIKIKNREIRENLFNKELESITLDHEKLIRSTRIQLEKEAEVLQLELQSTKNNVFLNSEKFNYNFQVLQKRDDENIYIRGQQKARQNKLSEVILTLNKKIREKKEETEIEVKQLQKEIFTFQKNIKDLQTKSFNFFINNMKKYQNIWKAHDQKAKSLILQISNIGKMFYEKEVGLEWNPVSQNLFLSLENFYKNKNRSSKHQKLHCDEFQQIEIHEHQLENTKLLQNILDKVTNQAGFLLEDKLLEILQPYAEKQKTLVKIDNIFSALNINTVEDIKLMTEYFLLYSWCPNCSPFEILKQNIIKNIKQNFDYNFCCDAEYYEELNKIKIKATPKKGNCFNHYYVSETSSVITGLKNFLWKKFYKGIQCNEMNKQNLLDFLHQMSKSDIEDYWTIYALTFSDENTRLKKSLEYGLNYYLKVLKERNKLVLECEILKRQNMEFNKLLKK